jgi:hypothetical protein
MLAIGRRPAALGQRTSALSTPVAVLMPPPLSVERDLAVAAGSCNGGVDQQLGEVENLAAMHTLTALLLDAQQTGGVSPFLAGFAGALIGALLSLLGVWLTNRNQRIRASRRSSFSAVIPCSPWRWWATGPSPERSHAQVSATVWRIGRHVSPAPCARGDLASHPTIAMRTELSLG